MCEGSLIFYSCSSLFLRGKVVDPKQNFLVHFYFIIYKKYKSALPKAIRWLWYHSNITQLKKIHWCKSVVWDLFEVIYFWRFESNIIGFLWFDLRVTWKNFTDVITFHLELKQKVSRRKEINLLTSHHNTCQYQLSTLFIWTRTWFYRLILFTINDRYCWRYCWEKKTSGEKEST